MPTECLEKSTHTICCLSNLSQIVDLKLVSRKARVIKALCCNVVNDI